MSELTDLIDAINRLRQGIDDQAASNKARGFAPNAGGAEPPTGATSSQSVSQDEAAAIQKKYGISPQTLQLQGLLKPAAAKATLGDEKKPVESRQDEAKKKSLWSVEKFNQLLNRATLALGGMVTVGLRNTVEGYKLGLAFERLAYQVADAMKGPIDFLTKAINQISAEFNFLNKIPFVRDLAGFAGFALLATWALKGLWTAIGPLIGLFKALGLVAGGWLAAGVAVGVAYRSAMRDSAKVNDIHNAAMDKIAKPTDGRVSLESREKILKTLSEPSDFWERMVHHTEPVGTNPEVIKRHKGAMGDMPDLHAPGTKPKDISPMYQTGFGALTSLWEQMNKAVTENPGMDVVKSWLETHLQPAIDKFMGNNPAPQPARAGAIGP